MQSQQCRLAVLFEMSPRDRYEILNNSKLIITKTKFPSFRNEEKTILLSKGWEIESKPKGLLDGFLGWVFGYTNIILTPRHQFGEDAEPIHLNTTPKTFYHFLQNIL